ncbi:MAG: tRNA pseudouridine(13) synthase TruD [Candidatus Nitrosocaldus sp.]
MQIVPDLDRMIGLEVYSTTTEGVKGRIKRRKGSNGYGHGYGYGYGYDNFVVEEVIDHSRVSISKVNDGKHRYPVFILRKEGIDTIHALKELESKYGLKLNALGLKDANALTLQYVTTDKVIGEELHTRHCVLTLAGYSDRMLRKRELVGNRFTITIELESSIDYDDVYLKVQRVMMDVKARRVGNFYGYQRFGSIRPVTHLIGKAIVKRRFKEAVDTFLTYVGEHESEQSRRVRLMLGNLNAEIVEGIPCSMDLERELAKGIIKDGDPIKALRRLPVSVRRLFVEAYQAYIFNRALSTAIREGYDISTPRIGDICFTVDANNRVCDICRYDDTSNAHLVPAMPLAGFAFKPIGRFGAIVEGIMKEEEISTKDFYIKEMQEVSIEGGFRPLPLLLLYNMFEINKDDESIQVRFALPKGSYATILLREIIKPVRPALVGF